MKKYTLSAIPRDIFGHKVKALRTHGMIPATMYGKKVKSTSLSIKADEFNKVFRDAGESGLVELALSGQTKPVLIHNVQLDPVTDTILHAELHQVDLKEKVTARVPLVFIGSSPVVVQKQGVLITVLDEVDVEALPTDLPENIEIDVSKLTEINQEITVGDLPVPKETEIQTDRSLTVVKVGSLVSKEVEEEQAAQAAEKAQAAAEEETRKGVEGAETPQEQPEAQKEKVKEPQEKTEAQ